MIVTKRTFLASASAAIGGLALGGCSRQAAAASPETFEIVKTPDKWRAILTPAQFKVLRQEGTERAGSSPLNDEKRRGTYVCAGCALPVYSSKTKFESGTGWPSFTHPFAPGAVTEHEDISHGMRRVEVRWA